VNLANTLRHYFRFGQPDVISQRVNLPIGIGDAHIIHIDKRDCANPRTRQRFRRPGADTANTHHTNTSTSKQLQRFFTIQTRCDTKTLTPGITNYHRHSTSELKRVRLSLTLSYPSKRYTEYHISR